MKLIFKKSCSEGVASNITVTIPAISGKDGVFKVEKIIPFPDYEPPTTFTMIEQNNIGVLKLSTEIPASKLGVGRNFKIFA